MKNAMAFATAVAPLLVGGTLLEYPPLAAPLPRCCPPSGSPATGGDYRKSGKNGGRGSHRCKRDQSPLRGTSLPPRRQRALCRHYMHSPTLLHCPPHPLAPCRGRTNQVARGRPPAGNEAINQDGQWVGIYAVGWWHTPPSSPSQFSQLANPPILLCVRLSFQSRSYRISAA
jgi:hypothetical protein